MPQSSTIHFCRLLVPAFCVALAGCAEQAWWEQSKRDLDGGDVLLTTSTLRAIHRVDVSPSGSQQGRKTPDFITCAEPSPDVAKALSNAFGGAVSAKAEGLEGIDPEVAVQISRARAESLAQMTERLGTIQLLRDGLYRACEAYANGAISETTYALMLGRFDDTMVTMLLGELAAGNFGRQLAALGGEASSEGEASLEREQEEALEEIEEAVEDAQGASAREARAEAALDEARADAAAEAAPEAQQEAANEIAEREQDLADASADRERAERRLRTKIAALAKAKATATASPAQAITADRADVSASLVRMQERYLHNINDDALMAACITALDRDVSADLLPAAMRLGAATAALETAQARSSQASAAALESLRQTVAREQQTWAMLAGNARISTFAAHCLTGVLPLLAAKEKDILDRRLAQGDSEAKLNQEIDTLRKALEKIRSLAPEIAPLLQPVSRQPEQ